jgi:hypothetical protein
MHYKEIEFLSSKTRKSKTRITCRKRIQKSTRKDVIIAQTYSQLTQQKEKRIKKEQLD